jgi:hypothetical protein
MAAVRHMVLWQGASLAPSTSPCLAASCQSCSCQRFQKRLQPDLLALGLFFALFGTAARGRLFSPALPFRATSCLSCNLCSDGRGKQSWRPLPRRSLAPVLQQGIVVECVPAGAPPFVPAVLRAATVSILCLSEMLHLSLWRDLLFRSNCCRRMAILRWTSGSSVCSGTATAKSFQRSSETG